MILKGNYKRVGGGNEAYLGVDFVNKKQLL